MRELLLGCGGARVKRLSVQDRAEWAGLVTLDINADHKPDVVHDLAKLPYPFADNEFDEIHAYDVMEHIGQQGDWRWFFDQWSELWRILKPGGMFFGISPYWGSAWAWGDPGHTRIISGECLTYLVQPQYDEQVGKSPMTDYRFVYQADFDVIHNVVENGAFQYVLRAIKPSRVTR